jgi:hypothetical protein
MRRRRMRVVTQNDWRRVEEKLNAVANEVAVATFPELCLGTKSVAAFRGAVCTDRGTRVDPCRSCADHGKQCLLTSERQNPYDMCGFPADLLPTCSLQGLPTLIHICCQTRVSSAGALPFVACGLPQTSLNDS